MRVGKLVYQTQGASDEREELTVVFDHRRVHVEG